MQNANTILSMLSQKSQNDEHYAFQRIYRNLYNREYYVNAYAKIQSKEGNMTEGVDNRTIDGFKYEMIDTLIEKLKTEQYYPKPVRRTYIPKKNGKTRPLGIPSFEDKLLQEVIRQLLESIYEPIFSDNSHGFRPDRSCHTALCQIKNTMRGANWIIEGDITGCFDNIDHTILLNILSQKIEDGRFIELIRRFLKAGYLEFKQMHRSLSGCPQGGTISPILSNIYLNEFDKYMDEIINKNTKGKKRRSNPEYQRLRGKRYTAIKNGKLEEIQRLTKVLQSIPSLDSMDSNFTRVRYVRYADDFVIAVIGSKEMAESIKEDVAKFLKNKLNLELNQEKTLITNLRNEKANFLGYEFTKAHSNTKMGKDKQGNRKRSVNGQIQLLVPHKVINQKIREFTQYGEPCVFKPRLKLPVLDIINEYNAEIRGLYNYYCLATNVSQRLYKFKYYHYFSMVHTIARKENISVKKVIKRYGIDVPVKGGTGTRRIVGVKYHTKKGEKTMTYFNDRIVKKDFPEANVYDSFGYDIGFGSQLITRLNANKCEVCGSTENIEVHHVRKLKDIKDKYKKRGRHIPNWVLIMSKMNRKTLIVCKNCHWDIHGGK